jgi:hypothetical protein
MKIGAACRPLTTFVDSSASPHHANFDETSEEVLDLLGTVGSKAIAGIERPSSSVVSEDPKGRIAIADGGVEQLLAYTATPIRPAEVDGVEVEGDVQARLGSRTSCREADNNVAVHGQGRCLIRVEHSSPYADGPFKITRDRRQQIVCNQSGVRLSPAGEVATGRCLDVRRYRWAQDYLVGWHHGSKMILPK